jgi:hypothetical protein
LFWNRQFGSDAFRDTPYSRELLNMRLAVDRFHRRGHKHPMCNTTTNPDCSCNGNRDVFDNINSSIAEQSFSYLSRFKFTLRGLAYPNSTIYMILLLHLWNVKRTKMRPDHFGLAAQHFSDTIKPMFLTKCVYETLETSVTFDINQTNGCRIKHVGNESDEDIVDENEFLDESDDESM